MHLAWSSCVGTAPGGSDVASEATPIFYSTEALFEALEGRVVTVAHQSWRIEVFSISEEREARWLQLALRGEPGYTLMLRLGALQGPKHAVQILSTWLARPAQNSNILNVA
jgi:hypothetical protein